MPIRTRSIRVFVLVGTALLANAAPPVLPLVARAAAAMNAPSGGGDVKTLQPALTEQGQRVVYDGYTWQRRELDKHLPLDQPWPAERDMSKQFKRFGIDHPPMPEDLPVPSRIMHDIYLVNSAPNLTYLIDAGPQGLVLVDPGLTSNVDTIRANVRTLGFDPANIKWVINTHAHFDHAMADAAFQHYGAKVLAGRDDVPAIEKGTLITGKAVLPPDIAAHYPLAHVDWTVDDGETLSLGNKSFIAISTPGHTPGSTCYLLQLDGKNILFGGDTVLFDYRLGQTSPFADDAAYLRSLRKLDALSQFVHWDVLLPGHGTIALDRASDDVHKAAIQVAADQAAGTPVDALPFGTSDYRRRMFGRK